MNDAWWVLLLIVAANGAPILLRKLLRNRFQYPIDFKYFFVDGKRLFGNAKTWPGTLSIFLVSLLLAWAIGFGVYAGLLAGVGIISGDLLSSFIKRRLGLPVSSMALGLDQIPESLFPYLLLMERLNLDVNEIIIGVTCFVVLELAISRLLYWLKVRDRPY